MDGRVTASTAQATQADSAGAAGTAVAQGLDVLRRGLLLDSLSWRKIGLTVIVLLAVWLAQRVLQRVIRTTVEDRALQYRWGKAISYGTSMFAALFIASIWVDGLRQIGTFLGLFTAGVAIALKDLLVDLAGWVVVVTKPPFQLGDRIQVGEHAGTSSTSRSSTSPSTKSETG